MWRYVKSFEHVRPPAYFGHVVPRTRGATAKWEATRSSFLAGWCKASCQQFSKLSSFLGVLLGHFAPLWAILACSQCHLESFIVGYAGSKLCSWRSTDDLQNFLETSKELNDFVTLNDSAYVTPPSFRFTIHGGTQLQPLFCFSALTHVLIAGISAEVQVQFVPKVEQRCKESACISYANLRVQVTQGAIRSI